MAQTKVTVDWKNQVAPAIARNKQPRINWKKCLGGLSLNQYLSKLRGQGVALPYQAYDIIVNKHPELTAEHKRRLKISVAARYGEQKCSEKWRVKK